MPRFDVEVQLSGRDGNAFSIIGAVDRALRGIATSDERKQFSTEAMSGDYANVIQTAARWVTIH
tara:strand:+ start:677 stop:868 length:192 start_codon:yes stop_codon:yes gene_type:complete